MPNFTVTYKVCVEAGNCRDAARLVGRWLRDSEVKGPVLEVTSDETAETETLDVSDISDGVWIACRKDGMVLDSFTDYVDAVEEAGKAGCVRFVNSHKE